MSCSMALNLWGGPRFSVEVSLAFVVFKMQVFIMQDHLAQ